MSAELIRTPIAKNLEYLAKQLIRPGMIVLNLILKMEHFYDYPCP